MHKRMGVMSGESVLALCAWFGHNKAAQLLIDAKADLHKGFVPPIKTAAHNDNVDAWHGAKKYGCRIYQKNNFTMRPLLF